MSNKPQKSSGRKRRKLGQSLMETALTMPIMIMIFSGLLDIGRLYFVFVAMEDAAGEAALYMSINPDCETTAGGSECADPNNATWRANNASSGQATYNSITFNFYDSSGTPLAPGTSPTLNDTVEVIIGNDVTLVTPFVQGISPLNPIHLEAQASTTVIRDPTP